MLSTFHQCVLNLVGKSDDPLRLSGAAMDEDSMLKEATTTGNSYAESLAHFNRLSLLIQSAILPQRLQYQRNTVALF